MAQLVYQSMSRNSVTTPSSAATQLSKSTGVGDPEIGLLMTTAINAECLVDPDDKVGFRFLHQGTSTSPPVVSIAAGEGWQAPSSALSFTVGSSSTTTSTLTFMGPFESAKYVRYDSTTLGVGSSGAHIALSLTSAVSGTVRVVAFKLPTVSYAT